MLGGQQIKAGVTLARDSQDFRAGGRFTCQWSDRSTVEVSPGSIGTLETWGVVVTKEQ